MRVQFNQSGTFQALYAAEDWCREHGISVGQSCATGPTGLLFGHYDWIAKWRNLTESERKDLHGTMSGDMRNGPVVIDLKDEAVLKHWPGLEGDVNTEDSTAAADKELGLIWWNSLSEHGRAKWAAKAGGIGVTDAWSAFKAFRTDQTR